MSVLPQLERDLAEAARRRLPARPMVARRRWLTPSPWVAGLSVAIALAIGVVAIGSLRDARVPLRLPAATAGYQAVSGLVGGVPQSGRRLGSAGAPVRVTLYGDLECQQCRHFLWSTGFARFVNSDVRSGQAQISYRSLCTTTCNSRGLRVFDVQQAAAYAAGRQGLFWQYALLFYREQGHGKGYVTRHYLVGLADQVVGLNVRRWQRVSRSGGPLDQVRAEEKAATRAQILGTPTLHFRGPKAGLTLAAGPSYAVLARAVRVAQLGCPKHWRTLGFVHCRDFV